jgi:cell fate regulator YaaT (PSP1 superfamily)
VALDGEERESIKKGELIVVLSHRGEELAEVVGPLNGEQENEYRSLRTISEHGEGPVRGGDPVVTDLDFIRAPTDGDMGDHEFHANQEGDNLRVAQELVEWHKLPIKLIDDEMILDGKKLFFYFTSDQRVDFRTLVRDLARRFKTRIELRQMGVRDEARIIRGISSCGLPCCCSYWLNQFAPIGIKMVKEQNIALNPSKISGICGRLMCCMSFEHKVYKEMWNGLPAPGSKIKTPNGNYVVQSLDIANNAVRCHKPSGGDIAVPKDLFPNFRQTVMSGEEWEVQAEVPAKADSCGRSCVSCRSRDFISGEDGGPRLREHEASEKREVSVGTGASPDADKQRPACDQAERTAHKTGRRRGRRSGRKVLPAAAETVAKQSEQGAARKNDRLFAPATQKRVLSDRADSSKAESQSAEPQPAADTEKRSRRRRKRPKRSA